jgi:hypothetical protein
MNKKTTPPGVVKLNYNYNTQLFNGKTSFYCFDAKIFLAKSCIPLL